MTAGTNRYGDAPGVGDNSGSVARELLADAREAAAAFAARRDEFVAAMKKFVLIRDRHDVGAAGDLIGMARDVFDIVDKRRTALVEPHDRATERVNAFFREFWQPVADEVAELRRKLDAFAQAEADRISAQEEEQRRFEAAARGKAPAATAPPPATDARRRAAPAPRRQNVRGDYGANVVFGETDVIEVDDWRQLPDFIMFAADVREAIIKVARPMVKQKLEIPGLKVSKAAATSVRR